MKHTNKNRQHCALLLGAITIWVYAGCDGRTVDYFDMIDLYPPQFTGGTAQSPRTIALCFDEAITIASRSVQISAPMQIERQHTTDCGIAFDLSADMIPGNRYTVSVTVADQNGNSLDIITNIYGYNDQVPELVINEFTTRGSSRHPDVVELYLYTAGNIGGVTLYEGSMQNWESRKILPAVELPAGSYILVHFKPQGIAAEVDETQAFTDSGGLDAHEAAWDFWVEDGNGLPGNNGALVLSATPTGEIMDAVIYTNRTSESDTRYGGFGSKKNRERAEHLHEAGAWQIASAPIRPEDAVFIDKSTATRSIGRNSASLDTDSKADWHIVPTATYSFGEQNSDEVYRKK